MSLCLLVNSINICLLFVQKYALNEAKVNEITFIIRFSDILLKMFVKMSYFHRPPVGCESCVAGVHKHNTNSNAFHMQG